MMQQLQQVQQDKVDLLTEIANNTRSKRSNQIILDSRSSRIKTNFNPPIQLEKDHIYELGLLNLETYFSFPNIDSSNNYFRYSPNNGSTYYEISIPTGSYSFIDVANYLQQKMKDNGHYNQIDDYYEITFSANVNTLQSVMVVESGYKVDMTASNSVAKFFGFTGQIYGSGTHTSQNLVNILSVNSVRINCDRISGSYVNGSQSTCLYSFFPSVNPGAKILESPRNVLYLPLVNTGTISSLTVEITDQDGKQLDFRGENISIRLQLREV
jgi:hypothetical protein|tara:strand:+ start:4519 stop:5325 length:807 start_codon:yes stop_codon:yes gene_type:complete